MRLDELTDLELIFTDISGTDGDAVLREFSSRLGALGRVSKPDLLLSRLRERESLGSTALGHGVAVPHCRLPGVSKLLLAIGLCRKGVDFSADDGKPVKVFFLLVSPDNAAVEHLQCLAAISKWIRDGRLEGLPSMKEPEEVLRLIGETVTEDA
jgi:PTS system nitrogen regulatory IIA component